jgi:hypothetical protein
VTTTEEDEIEAAYGSLRDLAEVGRLGVVDRLLARMETSAQRASVLLSVLTVTAPADIRRELPSRPDFYRRVKRELARRLGQVVAADCLEGLE